MPEMPVWIPLGAGRVEPEGVTPTALWTAPGEAVFNSTVINASVAENKMFGIHHITGEYISWPLARAEIFEVTSAWILKLTLKITQKSPKMHRLALTSLVQKKNNTASSQSVPTLLWVALNWLAFQAFRRFRRWMGVNHKHTVCTVCAVVWSITSDWKPNKLTKCFFPHFKHLISSKRIEA